MEAYRKLCAEAERDFEGFWARLARETALVQALHQDAGRIQGAVLPWFYDGELNASYNCLDRHLKTQPDKIAIIFEADDGKVTKITYKELYHDVCKFANALQGARHQEGRPRADLHADVDPGRGRDAGLRAHRRHAFGGVRRLLGEERCRSASSTPAPVAVITADGQFRGGKEIAAQAGGRRGARAWAAARRCSNVIVYKRTGQPVPMKAGRDIWWHDAGARPGRHLRADVRRTPSIRCSSSTPRARPASRRASSTPPAATCCWRALHDEVGVRLQAERRLLVHRRRRLGDRAYLHRLRAARRGRHRSDLRGRADLSRTPAASGRSSRTTRSTCSTPRRRRSAR